MSSPVDATQAWANEYQARFGVAPGTRELKAELESCIQMCKELLLERERLRAELTRVQEEREDYYHALNTLLQEEHTNFTMTKEEALAQFGKQPSVAELIAELEQVQKERDMYHQAFGALMKKELANYRLDKDALLAETA